jgi:bifunctional UDP-N-acetylglucosamine pyrophosphorylase/glucosamine-1-phosphate N-acetyltransferase
MENMENQAKVKQLMGKGVKIHNPDTIVIGDDVSVDRISAEGVVIHEGCRIFGSATAILPHCEIGYEGPVTIENCQLGRQVKLNGGFFSHSTFLEKASFGLGAHVRAGCLLEEEANGAHTVGLKQTILFPFVTLGSLINFCDCLMAGGTSRKNHSEVGSSYIHFNYTPDQDKATPSLIGDVPRGVMLNQRPIFLGGQGGLVGPLRLGYGTVIAAGTIYRKDFPQGDGLLFAGSALKRQQPLHPGLYHNLKRIIVNNINYIANVISLKRWYRDVRSLFFGPDPLGLALYEGALEKIEMALAERVKRLKEVADTMPASIEIYQSVMKDRALQNQLELRREFFECWSDIEKFLTDEAHTTGNPELRDEFLGHLSKGLHERGKDYLRVVQGLGDRGSRTGTEWLQGIIDEINTGSLGLMPSFRTKRHNNH